MILGVSELQYIRLAILTIPANQLPIIPVSYGLPQSGDQDLSGGATQEPVIQALVSPTSSRQALSRVELLA